MCAIRIRLPDGSNQARRFLKSDTVQTLYDFVDSLPQMTLPSYQLVSNFPRKNFDRGTLGDSLEAAGLFPQAALFVQALDN